MGLDTDCRVIDPEVTPEPTSVVTIREGEAPREQRAQVEPQRASRPLRHQETSGFPRGRGILRNMRKPD